MCRVADVPEGSGGCCAAQLKGTSEGYQLYTLDHGSGEMFLNVDHRYDDPLPPVHTPPPSEDMVCDPEKGWVCAELTCDLDERGKPRATWLPAGPHSLLAVQGNLLVEYDPEMQSPIGVVTLDLKERQVRLVDAAGATVAAVEGDGAGSLEAVAVELVDASGGVERIERNERGGFFRVFQPNKWRAKKEKERREAEQAQASSR